MHHIKTILFGHSVMLLGVGFIAGTVGDSYSEITAVGFVLLFIGFFISLFGLLKKRK